MGGLSSISDAIEDLKKGKFVVVLDNDDRENEGDLIMPAAFATEESLAFMIRYCSGVICAAATQERIDALRLPLMVSNNTEAHQCKFTVSVDLKEGTTTGISAADRALTINALGNDKVSHDAFNKPGHIFPLVASAGGVLARAGHTEAAVDLARLAGTSPSGYLCEINDDNGRMMRRPELQVFAQTHGLKLITISDLIRYRCANESSNVRLPSDGSCHTPFGKFDHQIYATDANNSTGSIEVLKRSGGDSKDSPFIVYFVEEGMAGVVKATFAQKQIAANAGGGMLIHIGNKSEMIRVSGEVMASQAIFGIGMQLIRTFSLAPLGAAISLLSENDHTFDLEGFGVTIHATKPVTKLLME